MGSLPRLDAKLLYRRLDSLLGGIDPTLAPRHVLPAFLEDAFRTLRDDLRLKAASLYFEQRDGFSLVRQVGDAGGAWPDALDPARPPLTLVFQHRVYIFSDPLSETAPTALAPLALSPSAALVVGRRPNRHVFLFLMSEGWVREEVDFAFNTLRAALGARLMEERVRGSFREAAEIQQSLLVEEPPAFPGFELAAHSLPAEEVGGDFYDFFSFADDDEMLGLAIGDASGHGLPAALLVRDVVTGLRMGVEKHLKVAHAFEKLNRVIHRSNLSSRFVSLFYGELERDGNLVYVNAGHQPPLLFGAGGVSELRTGGTVIGPLPEAQFRRGIAYLAPGDLLVLCTDGILERRDPRGAFFGDDRLRALVEAGRELTAELLLDRIFAAATEFGQGRPWEDDATAVVVRRASPPVPA
jgi:sigma-B regulation protein RsbU (phosphoserine phosphatase)